MKAARSVAPRCIAKNLPCPLSDDAPEIIYVLHKVKNGQHARRGGQTGGITKLPRMTIVTDERCTGYFSAGHPERPARISGTLEKLRAQTELKLKWAAPLEVSEEQIARAHTRQHIAHVKNA